MSREIGTLEVKKDAKGALYMGGTIESPDYSGKVSLQPAEKTADASPDYRIYGVDMRTGEIAEIGAAWVKTPKAGGDQFLSVSIDHPIFSGAFYCAAFRVDDPGKEPKPDAPVRSALPEKLKAGERWRFIWSRPRGGQIGGGRSVGASIGDRIPF